MWRSGTTQAPVVPGMPPSRWVRDMDTQTSSVLQPKLVRDVGTQSPCTYKAKRHDVYGKPLPASQYSKG
eukprot:2223697-Alexandrium_andersonii.AAC.1